MNNKHNIKDSKKWLTTTVITRWTGLFAITAGILYIVIQFIHPSDDISSVDTNLWVIVACLTMAIAIFNLIGITGIYTRQVKESGWLGLIGFLMFSLFWLSAAVFSFIEAFVLPLLTTMAPQFVEGFIGIFGGFVSEVDLGILPTIGSLAGVMYILGGFLFGIAIFRAKVLSRLGGALLAFSAVATIGASIVPHPFDRIFAIPMGIALIWLGYALWAEHNRKI
ncbi:hypothetical protein ACRC6Q_08320 [Planococcus sp. SE5232]|uniref:hypothetical protein n=1 Tax=unclassified Planococcus (in: firmicutes) TaxID=2662419 RepID=UPI003D6A5DD5